MDAWQGYPRRCRALRYLVIKVPPSTKRAADVVVVVVESPQTPEDDPEERLRTRWETGKSVDGLRASDEQGAVAVR